MVLRFGKFQRKLEPGLHWIYPFGIDRVLEDNVVPTTRGLSPQSLVTSDGHSVTVAVLVTFQTSDVKKLLLEIEGAESVMIDATYGIVAAEVGKTPWDDLRTEAFAERVTKNVRRRAFRYGIEVLQVQFSDIAKCRSHRLWTDSADARGRSLPCGG